MPEAPKSISFARIVVRLMTQERGWRVDDLKSNFQIANRTYRQWRSDLQNYLPELHHEDGESRIQEIRDGEALYLRLVDAPASGPKDGDYYARIAALHLAQRLLGFVDGTTIGGAMRTVMDHFRHRLRDRDFHLGSTLLNVDRLFYEVPFASKDYSEQGEVLEAILKGLLSTVWLDVEYESSKWGTIPIRLAPYTLCTYASALYLIGRSEKHGNLRYYAVDRIASANTTAEKFEYPSAVAYHPEEWTGGGFGLFRGDDDAEEVEFEVLFANKPWLKRLIQERRWTDNQAFEETDDGRLRMTFRTTSTVQVWPWLRSFGEDVELVSPDWP